MTSDSMTCDTPLPVTWSWLVSTYRHSRSCSVKDSDHDDAVCSPRPEPQSERALAARTGYGQNINYIKTIHSNEKGLAPLS
jgi:hypothetical protein